VAHLTAASVLPSDPPLLVGDARTRASWSDPRAIPEPATTAETSTTTYSAHFSILLSTDDLNGVQNSSLVNQLMVFHHGVSTQAAAVSLRATGG
jgi:hypothetical protein